MVTQNQINGASKDMKKFISEDAPEYLRHAVDDLSDVASDAMETTKSTVAKYPIYTIIGAVCVGALLGLFVKRSYK